MELDSITMIRLVRERLTDAYTGKKGVYIATPEPGTDARLHMLAARAPEALARQYMSGRMWFRLMHLGGNPKFDEEWAEHEEIIAGPFKHDGQAHKALEYVVARRYLHRDNLRPGN